MQKQLIKQEIIELINRLKEQSSLLENSDRLPEPDVMVMLHKIQELHKKFIVFEHLNSYTEISKPIVETAVEPISTPTSTPTTAPTPSPSLEKEVIEPPAVKPVAPPAPEPKEEKVAAIDIHLMKQEVTTNEEGKKMGVLNLSAVIGINDRFQFASELFNGNMQEYNIAIQQLSASETIESALIYFNNLHQLYNWDQENKTVQRLLSILNKNANK